MDPAILALFIPILALMIPIVAILSSRTKDQGKERERIEARKMYERIVRDKLDVMKTAIAMGFQDNELKELDARLERLVGSEKMQELLDAKPSVPVAPTEALDAELTRELDAVRRMRSERQ